MQIIRTIHKKMESFNPQKTNRFASAPKIEEDFIYGTRAVIEAIQADRPINKLLIQQGCLQLFCGYATTTTAKSRSRLV